MKLEAIRKEVAVHFEVYEQSLKEARMKLSEAAIEGDPRHLAEIVNKIAGYEGRLRVLHRISNCATEDLIKRVTICFLTEDLGDSGSGRTNDVMRSRCDGTRAAAKLVLEIIDFLS